MDTKKKKQNSLESEELLKLKKELILLKEKQVELREGLPFLYGWKWYPWAREFYESANKLNFLCAANQISKSSTQIRKCINWATNRELWPTLWARKPVQFWYLYPTANQATIEFKTKWQQFLPRGRFKDEAIIDGKPNYYAWKADIKNKEIFYIHFFVADVYVYFKSYSQDVQALQTGTCDAIFCDEELPIELYDELIFRISASDGYFHMVFTATLGQEFWREVLEETGEKERLKEAFKRQVSMYDCLKYEDGTDSHWTMEKIQIVKNRCKTHNEVLRRVYGRFVVDAGLKYEAFNIKTHMRAAREIPKDWFVYGAADVGSGGEKGHPSAICFVAVSPDFRQGEVFLGWRGDGIPTTASDVVQKFQELKGKRQLQGQYYDWACKDFFEIASRMGEPFIPAEKSHEKGEQVINVLFKNNMLSIHETEELEKLAWELTNLRVETAKNKAKDDFCDALRYAVTRIPWDWSVITGALPDGYQAPEPNRSPLEQEIEDRRRAFQEDHDQESGRIEEEFAEWNDFYG